MKICLLLTTFILCCLLCTPQSQSLVNLDWQNAVQSNSSETYLLQSVNLNGDQLTGHVDGNSNELHLSCFNTEGTGLWTAQVNWDQGVYSGVMLVEGGAVIYGSKYNEEAGGVRGYVAKLDNFGSEIWGVIESSTYASIISLVSLDQEGNIWCLVNSINGFDANCLLQILSSDGDITSEYNLSGFGADMVIQTNQAKVLTLQYSGSEVQGNISKVDNDSGVLLTSPVYSIAEIPSGFSSIKPSSEQDFYLIVQDSINGQLAIQVYGIDNDFQPNWNSTIQVSGYHLHVQAVSVNDAGDLIICGEALDDDFMNRLFVGRISQSGEELQMEMIGSEASTNIDVLDMACSGEGVAILVRQDANLMALGLREDQITWTFTLMEGTGSQGLIQSIDSGYSVSSSSDQEIRTSCLSILELPFELNQSSDHLESRVVVKFKQEVLEQEIVANEFIHHGRIGQLLQADLITELAALTGIDLTSKCHFAKVFPNLSPQVFQSQSRSGKAVQIPSFYSWIELVINEEFDEVQFCETLAQHPAISFAEPHFIYQLHSNTNDQRYSEQHSLSSHGESANGINVQEAWEYSTGDAEIKVGIFDQAIWWNHEDLGDGTLEGSVVKGGHDYANNVSLELVSPNDLSHGTAVAGIVGAVRNNSLGISGIAGGDYSNNEAGSSLYSMIVFSESGFAGLAACANAIVEGASEATNYGFGLHVHNYSWGGPESQLLDEAVKYAWQNDVVQVASRGNSGDSQSVYPSTIRDQRILSVGANGTEGMLMQGDELNAASSYGLSMDLLAPGHSEGILSLINFDNSHPGLYSCSDPELYSCFNNTSAASAHVTGAMALALAYHNQSVSNWPYPAPEDLEYLVQSTAVNPDNELNITYTDEQGWGRLDAGGLLKAVDHNMYRLRHFNFEDMDYSITEMGSSLELLVDFEDVASGQYYGDRHHFNGSGQVYKEPNENVLAHWPRRNSTRCLYPMADYEGIDDEAMFQVQELQDQILVSVEADLFHITQDDQGNSLDVWVPCAPANLLAGYSVYSELAGTSNIETTEESAFEIMPNPASKFITVSGLDLAGGELRIYNLVGELEVISQLSEDSKVLDISSLPPGTHFVQIETDSKTSTQPLIKQ